MGSVTRGGPFVTMKVASDPRISPPLHLQERDRGVTCFAPTEVGGQRSSVNGPILACRFVRPGSLLAGLLVSPKTCTAGSCRFPSCCCLSSARVLSLFSAARATCALNAGVWFRLHALAPVVAASTAVDWGQGYHFSCCPKFRGAALFSDEGIIVRSCRGS